MRIRIEPFGMRLSVRYALQTKQFIGLIYYVWKIKELKYVWNISATAINNAACSKASAPYSVAEPRHIVAGVIALIT